MIKIESMESFVLSESLLLQQEKKPFQCFNKHIIYITNKKSLAYNQISMVLNKHLHIYELCAEIISEFVASKLPIILMYPYLPFLTVLQNLNP